MDEVVGFVQVYMEIKCFGGNEFIGFKLIYEEINVIVFLSVVVSFMLWLDYN